jgi:predicted P-loop ATPase
MNISIYKNIHDSKSQERIPLDIFLENIKNGYWQDLVLPIRVKNNEDEIKQAKSQVPYVTISGVFGETRNRENLKIHSGFIAMDIDKLGNEVNGTLQLLQQDVYCYSAFTSISGTGVCALFKIDSERHADAFLGIADYLLKKYQIIVDPSGKDTCRPRFISFDPELFINDRALLFKKYLPKEKKRKIVSTIFVQSEFDEVVKKMVDANVSCVEDYRDWLTVSFGLADQFGEAGRQYFHQLSSCSSKYETSMCDRQYTHAIKREGRNGSKITIATIYYFAKQAGINVYSAQTQKIASVTSSQKRAGLDASKIIENLKKFEGIQDADAIVRQAFAANVDTEGCLVDNIRVWLRHNFNLKRNVITRKIEDGDEILTERDFNTMFLDAKILFDDLNFDLFMRVVLSRNTTEYNPIMDFIKSIEWDGEERINQLGACITSNTGTLEWRCLMVRRWFVGIVSSVFGFINELNFILVGKKNTGKTYFFSELLPEELKKYLGRSQLNRGTDDQILMCEKLIILNDEYGGKNKQDEKTEKGLMAAPFFSLRVPYGKGNEDVVRLATLAGTCNDLDVLDDATGNRRIIVMEATGKFDFILYNSLDKYQLIAEAYHLYQQGERPKFTDEEIDMLEANTDGAYSKVVMEAELIKQYFLTPEQTNPWDFMTTTQIKVFLENHTKSVLNINKIGVQLRKLGYIRSKKNGIYGYDIAQIKAG